MLSLRRRRGGNVSVQREDAVSTLLRQDICRCGMPKPLQSLVCIQWDGNTDAFWRITAEAKTHVGLLQLSVQVLFSAVHTSPTYVDVSRIGLLTCHCYADHRLTPAQIDTYITAEVLILWRIPAATKTMSAGGPSCGRKCCCNKTRTTGAFYIRLSDVWELPGSCIYSAPVLCTLVSGAYSNKCNEYS
jgi:hypothetical protein